MVDHCCTYTDCLHQFTGCMSKRLKQLTCLAFEDVDRPIITAPHNNSGPLAKHHLFWNSNFQWASQKCLDWTLQWLGKLIQTRSILCVVNNCKALAHTDCHTTTVRVHQFRGQMQSNSHSTYMTKSHWYSLTMSPLLVFIFMLNLVSIFLTNCKDCLHIPIKQSKDIDASMACKCNGLWHCAFKMTSKDGLNLGIQIKQEDIDCAVSCFYSNMCCSVSQRCI